MLPLFESLSDASNSAKLLLKLLDIKISETTIRTEIEEHPDYPSLLSISDMLNRYKVDNVAIRIRPDQIMNLPTPFITQIRGERKLPIFFTVVKHVGVETVEFYDQERNEWKMSSKGDFLKRGARIALLTEAIDGAGEKDYSQKIKKEKKTRVVKNIGAICISAIMIFAIAIALWYNGLKAVLPVIYCLFTLVGCALGAVLIWFDIDRQRFKELCTFGKKTNCEAVLTSKAAKIAGASLSTIGFSFFMGMLFLLLFSGLTNSGSLFILSWINIISLPFVCFSLYYQWRIAKHWCLLCLGVQAILVLQLITGHICGWYDLLFLRSITPLLILQTIAAFTIPLIITVILMPVLRKANESKSYRNELQRLKHNPQIFEALLKKQKIATESTSGLGLTLGNPNATHKLIKVCNPYCGPCSKAHHPMEELLENNPNIQVQIIFTATNNESDLTNLPVKHLLAIAENNDERVIKQALNDWYQVEKKDYEIFAQKHPIKARIKDQDNKIAAMNDWCNKTGIKFTPTFFISMANSESEANYYQLPEMYSVVDLQYFFSV